MMRALPGFRVALLALLSVAILRAETDGWLDLNRLDPAAAQTKFADRTDRQSRLGAALALLGVQPRTEARVHEARGIFDALRAADSNDETGIAATYQITRIDQLFAQPANPAAAIDTYRALLATHPGNAIAERASPKLALLLLYADVADAAWEERVTEITTLLPSLQSRAAQRDTRLVLADALLRLRGDHARALPLLEYCLERDLVVRPPGIANALLTAAECARVTGRKAEAAAYYQRYVREFPREPSVSEAARRAERLEKEAQ